MGERKEKRKETHAHIRMSSIESFLILHILFLSFTYTHGVGVGETFHLYFCTVCVREKEEDMVRMKSKMQ